MGEFQKNVDWEQFTGVKLFAWLGGLALFIGAIFFVKYSIDNNLNPFAIALGHQRAGRPCIDCRFPFSSIAIATAQRAHSGRRGHRGVVCRFFYGLRLLWIHSKMIGFGLFAFISSAAFVLAVFHQGRFISVLGAVGAYATPLLIQTVHPNLISLFLYLTVVNIGLFEVIRRTGWLPLSILVTAGTLLTLSAGAWGTHPPAEPYLSALIAIANLTVFSSFFWIYRGDTADNRLLCILYGHYLPAPCRLLSF